jgi:hypothetical protein
VYGIVEEASGATNFKVKSGEEKVSASLAREQPADVLASSGYSRDKWNNALTEAGQAEHRKWSVAGGCESGEVNEAEKVWSEKVCLLSALLKACRGYISSCATLIVLS